MGECGCIYVDCDEQSDVIDLVKRKARKQYKCGECGRVIEKGEEYEYASLLYDGSWDHYRTCEDCLSAREQFFCEGFYFQNLWEEVEHHVFERGGEIAGACIAALLPRAREKMCEIIEAYWEKYTDDYDETDDDHEWRLAHLTGEIA